MSTLANKITIYKSRDLQGQFSNENSPQSKSKPQSLTKREFLAPLANPYLKKFNVRRLTHTEEARKKSQERQEFPSKNSINLKKINGSVELKRGNKLGTLRMHTEKMSNSPYRMMKNLHTIDHEDQQSKSKFPFLTDFEREETTRYEVYYPGKRRIYSSKDFTDHNGDAKVTIGDSIGYRYEIKSLLGKGSFGQVFKAYDHKKKQFSAVKIIRNHPKFTAQAKVEIKILEQVIMKDPKFKSNIVQLKHGFFFRGHACLVFQLLHVNLYEFIKSFNFAGLSLDLIRRISIQILQGLQFFKKYDIIHCDLKPENILLKQENKTGVKIIDTGSGCYRSQQIYTYIQSRFYRAPEIIIGVSYTCAIDMWSFGCILCELFSGYPIFPGESEQQEMLMFMQVLGTPPLSFIDKGCRSHKFFQNGEPKIKPNSRGRIRKPSTKKLSKVIDCSSSEFVSLIQMCFKWDPDDRITPTEALLHPFIIQGLPDDLKRQHINQVHKDSVDSFI